MINFEKFRDWAESRFGDVVVKGKEIKINSPFTEDHKHHCWCNPSGGKKERWSGVYHCWKTDKKGSLISLVMMVDHCTYEEAMEILEGVDLSNAAIEKAIDELFDKKQPAQIENVLTFPPNTYLIKDLPEDDYFRNTAELYLKSRCLPTEGMMVCVSSQPWYNLNYMNRLIIPYYDKNGKLIYFNGRYLGKDKKILDELRYLGPPKEVGVGKEDVIYMPHWPKPGSKIYYTEGELDAKSIQVAGLNSGAWGGKVVSEKQTTMMDSYIPVVAVDNDDAGKGALLKAINRLRSSGFNEVRYVRRCTIDGKKVDWNDMLIKYGPDVLKSYLQRREKLIDDMEIMRMEFEAI